MSFYCINKIAFKNVNFNNEYLSVTELFHAKAFFSFISFLFSTFCRKKVAIINQGAKVTQNSYCVFRCSISDLLLNKIKEHLSGN